MSYTYCLLFRCKGCREQGAERRGIHAAAAASLLQLSQASPEVSPVQLSGTSALGLLESCLEWVTAPGAACWSTV